MRFAVRLFLILLLAAAVAWVAVRFFVLTPAVAERVRQAVEEAARESLAEPLTIDSVGIDLPGRVVAKGIRLGPPGRPALEARSAVVHLSLLNLARSPREPGLALKGLTLNNPRVRVARDGEGVWSFQRLLKPPEPGARPARLSFTVRIRGGSVRLEGAEAPGARPFSVLFEMVRGRVLVDTGRNRITWKLRADTGFAPGLRVSGRYHSPGKWMLRLRCPRLSLAGFPAAFLPPGLMVGGHVRRFDVALMPGVGDGFPLVEGGLDLDGVSVEAEGLPAPVSRIRGGVRFEGGVARFEGLGAEMGGGEVEVGGGVMLSPEGAVALRGGFEGVSLGELSRGVAELKGGGLRGVVSGSLLVEGTLGRPIAFAEVRGEDVAYGSSRFDRAELELLYGNRAFSIKKAELRRRGGVVALEGVVRADDDWSGWSGGLSARLERVGSDDLLGELGVGGGGRVGGEFSGTIVAAKEEGGPLLMSGSVRGEPLMLASYPEPLSLELTFSGDGGGWTIENLVVSDAESFIAAGGSVGGDGGLSIAIDGCGGDAARIASFLGEDGLPVSGWVECGGRIGGTVEEPAVDLDVRGSDLAFDTARGFTLSGGVRRGGDGWLAEARLFSRTASVRAEARLALDGGGGSVKIEAKGLPPGALVEGFRLAGVADLSYWDVRGGVVDCELDAEMREGTWKATGGAEGRGLLVYGESIERAEVRFAYDRALKLDKGRMRVGGEEVWFNGELTGERMRLDVIADAVELAEVNMFSAYRVAGRAGFKARVEGPYGGTTLRGEFSPAGIELRQIPLKMEGGTFAYKGGVLTVNETVARRGGEEYEVRGSYDIGAGNVDVGVRFEDASPATFQRLFGIDFWEEASGALDGSLRVIGVGGELSGTVEVESDRLAFGDFALTRLEAEGGFSGGVIEIEKLYAHNEVSQISGEGLIDLSRRSESLFNLEATSIDLDTLARLARLPFSASGYGDIYVEIMGDAGEMLGSMDAYEPSVAGLQFDRMRGQFHLARDAVVLQRFNFLREGSALELRAIVPIGESGEDLEVILKGKDLPLNIFNPFLEGSGVKLDGGFTLHDVAITEREGVPVYEGAVEVSGGVLHYVELGQPITGISGVFDLGGEEVEPFAAEFGGKKVEIAVVDVAFDGLYPSRVDVAFSDVSDAEVEYGGFYRGRVDFQNFCIKGPVRDLSVGECGGQPSIRFHHGAMELTGLPVRGAGATAEGGFQLTFADEVKIEVGDDVILRGGGNIKLFPRGELLLGGKLHRPSLKGTLVSTRGYVRPGYSDITFNVIEPVVIGFYSPGDIGIIPIYYAKGKARVGGLDVYIVSEGPMVDLAQIPAYQEFCQEYTVSSVDGGVAASAAPRILVGGEEEMLIPVCPSVRLFAYEDNDPAGTPMSVQSIATHLIRADEIRAGTPMSRILTFGAVGMFTPEISTIVEQSINLENFELNLDPNKDLLVELEKRLAPKTYVRLKRLFFSREIQQEMEFRYKFRKKSYILWNVDQDNEHRYEVEYRFTF